ncbi:hypothetical protein SAMN04515647_0865 [Cohaesibacter sp. ES.047]|nr:hypothetical protein SAMN04515647_0865 [Cohaesibacter sp. ES.047]
MLTFLRELTLFRAQNYVRGEQTTADIIMKNLGAMSAALMSIALSGCVTQTDYMYKPNTSYGTKADALLECKLQGAQRVPSNTRVGSTPVYVTPATTYCSGGYCNSYGGQVTGGDVYTYDANQELRDDLINQCLRRKGYTVTQVPVCRGKTVERPVSTDRIQDPKQGQCVVSTKTRDTSQTVGVLTK